MSDNNLKNNISYFFSWRGPPGKFVDFMSKHQKWYWVFVAIIMVSWISYDMGSLITRADVFNANQNIKGVLTVDDVYNRVMTNKGGRIIIISNTDARYIDISGSSWSVPGFAENVSKKELTDMRERGAVIDGDVAMTVTPVKTKPSDMVLETISSVVVKALFVSLYIAIIYFIFRQFSPSKNRFNKIKKSEASSVVIEDVAGYSGVKAELLEIIDYLKDPASFAAVGARPPKGVLLYGPPGNGKTLMAKAVAGEADAAFFEQSASSFINIFAGAGAKSVRKLFDEARKHTPAVIFIDEIDSVGASRSGASHDERVQTLNAILTEMDGFKDNTGIVVVAATNRIEILDEALVRPGRFDRKVYIPMPSQSDRFEIIKRHAATVSFETGIDWNFWAGQTSGFSGAEIAALINEAAIEAARSKNTLVTAKDLAAARDRVWIGVKNSGRVLSEEEKKVVAIHESGHAIVRVALGGLVEKISIIPRGMSLGVTVSAVEVEQHIRTSDDVFNDLCMLMAGRAAEYVHFGKVSSAASDDVARASNLARQALPTLGTEKWGSYTPSSNSSIGAAHIDDEAAKLVNKAFDKSCEIINKNKNILLNLSDILIKKEDLSDPELSEVLAFKFIN